MEAQQRKIMIIDDEAVICSLLKEVVELAGYCAIVCEGPAEAIRKFKAVHHEIDLVLMDMIMPEMNGQQLMDEFMKIDDSKKIIILSGSAIDREVNDLMVNSVYSVIKKPVSIMELLRVINTAMVS